MATPAATLRSLPQVRAQPGRARAELGQARDRATAGADGARRLVVLAGAIGRGEAGEQAIAEAADILDDPNRARLREMLDARRAAVDASRIDLTEHYPERRYFTAASRSNR